MNVVIVFLCLFTAISDDGEGLSPMAEENECDIETEEEIEEEQGKDEDKEKQSHKEEEKDDEDYDDDVDDEEKREMLDKLDGVVSNKINFNGKEAHLCVCGFTLTEF